MITRTSLIYWAFILCMVGLWNPNKSLSYIIPHIFLVLLLFVDSSRASICLRVLSLITLLLIHSLLTYSVYSEFSIQNFLLCFLTYSAVFFYLAVPRNIFSNDELEFRIVLIVCLLIAIESLIGICQGLASVAIHRTFDSDTGDLVTGTFDWFNLSQTRGFSNPIYVINICSGIIFLAAYRNYSKFIKITICLACISIILASVMHLTLLLIVSGTLAIFLTTRSLISFRFLKKFLASALLVMSLLLVLQSLLPSNFSAIKVFGEKASSLNLPKAIAYYRLATSVPSDHPTQPLFGFGAGQFNSKAALIGTESYFGSPRSPIDLPLIAPHNSTFTDQYLWDLWLISVNMTHGSSTVVPWSSWLAFVGEFGLVIPLIILCLFVFKTIANTKRPKINQNKHMCRTWLLLFLIFIGIQEHYWETPQAIFMAMILLKILERRKFGGQEIDGASFTAGIQYSGTSLASPGSVSSTDVPLGAMPQKNS